LLAIALALAVGAQRVEAGTLWGTVTADTTGRPIAGCLVIVEGTQYQDQSDENGMYEITGLPPGKCYVTAKAAGYFTKTVPSVKIGAESTRLDFMLVSETVQVRGRRRMVIRSEVSPVGWLDNTRFHRQRQDIRSERFLRLGLLELGPCYGFDNLYYPGWSPDLIGVARVLELTYCFKRFGVGLTGLEAIAGVGNDDPWGITGVAVLHGRYALTNLRGRTGFLYARNDSLEAVNSPPTCFTEAAVGLATTQGDLLKARTPYGRLSLITELDFFPLGVGIEIGAVAFDPWGQTTSPPPPSGIAYLELKLRLVSGNIRLGPR
jgi:hypothetical protein